MGSAETTEFQLSEADRRQVEEHGLTVEEIGRQLALLQDPPPTTRLDRACTVGDGILRLTAERADRLAAGFAEAAASGRFSKWVPASGAASRMFRSLVSAHRDGQANESTDRLLGEIDRFPFRTVLADTLAQRGQDLGALVTDGQAAPVLAAMLDEDGLGFATAAKALIPFHSEGPGNHGLTPLEEQLAEAAEMIGPTEEAIRIHFTIPEAQRAAFGSALSAITAKLLEERGARFDISLSIQGSETDTVAGDLEGGPFRDGDGRLIFRPGGHGSLLRNLQRFDGDLVFVRNIDNIQPAHRRGAVVRWNRILGGLLLEIEAQLAEIESDLGSSPGLGSDPDDGTLQECARRIASILGRPSLGISSDLSGEETIAELRDLLDRPLRIAGVVPNTGEPGGGPFWIRHVSEEMGPQIVELSQVDTEDEGQREIVATATHFNPVHLVCRVRDSKGRAYDLSKFTDPEAVFTSVKSHQGRDLRALEHPGLWNGAMARWNTIFVEVPGEIFAPVKTVFDLLRPEHQPED